MEIDKTIKKKGAIVFVFLIIIGFWVGIAYMQDNQEEEIQDRQETEQIDPNLILNIENERIIWSNIEVANNLPNGNGFRIDSYKTQETTHNFRTVEQFEGRVQVSFKLTIIDITLETSYAIFTIRDNNKSPDYDIRFLHYTNNKLDLNVNNQYMGLTIPAGKGSSFEINLILDFIEDSLEMTINNGLPIVSNFISASLSDPIVFTTRNLISSIDKTVLDIENLEIKTL